MSGKILEKNKERSPLLGERSRYLSKDDMQTTGIYVLVTAVTFVAFAGVAYSFYQQLTK